MQGRMVFSGMRENGERHSRPRDGCGRGGFDLTGELRDI